MSNINTNPFEKVQKMVANQRQVGELFQSLKTLISSMEELCVENDLAPKTRASLKDLRANGTCLLEELFITESRHNIREATAHVSARDIIESAQKQKSD